MRAAITVTNAPSIGVARMQSKVFVSAKDRKQQNGPAADRRPKMPALTGEPVMKMETNPAANAAVPRCAAVSSKPKALGYEAAYGKLKGAQRAKFVSLCQRIDQAMEAIPHEKPRNFTEHDLYGRDGSPA